jgi:hypothetical protein
MSPRLKLRAAATPLVMAGAVWATGAWSSMALGGGAQTPPPCGPDGVCQPNVATYGVHITRWRPFPGDVIRKPPTPATVDPEEEGIGGPKLPGATQEGQMGPTRAPRAEGAPGEAPAPEGEEDAAAAGLGTLPGEVPLPGIELPGIGQPAPAPEGGEAPAEGPAGPQGDPGAEPGADPLDPFGSAPPAPPAWLRNAALQQTAPVAVAALESLPVVTTAHAVDEMTPNDTPADAATFVAPPVVDAAAMDGPNLHGEDAPPTLPPALQSGISSVTPARRVAPPQASVAPAITQPVSVARVAAAKTASVEPTDDEMVIVASAEEPVGIQFVNPAEALVDPDAQGLQQAIYFEASDK